MRLSLSPAAALGLKFRALYWRACYHYSSLCTLHKPKDNNFINTLTAKQVCTLRVPGKHKLNSRVFIPGNLGLEIFFCVFDTDTFSLGDIEAFET